jgi:hypothetical protein
MLGGLRKVSVAPSNSRNLRGGALELFHMHEKDLARAVAADLGSEVLAAVEMPSSDDRTRALSLTGAMAVASFLVQCASLAVQVWQAKQDRALLVAALANSKELMEMYPRLDPEKRLGLMARVLKKFLPDSFGTPPRGGGAPVAEKRGWVASYLAKRGSGGDAATREFLGGATILMPFADQDNWIVYQNIGWVPDDADGTGVVRVDVPRGFVTDLASVPSYMWAILQRTGRYGNAAIYHDWLYWERTCPREVADRVFDRAMHDMGVDPVTRNAMWAGVRVFGGSYWDDTAVAKAAGEKRVLKRFPDSPTIRWEDWRRQPDVFA